MSVAEISHAIQSIGFLTYIRESGWTYPMILSTHLTTIALFGGLIAMTDLRILGLAMREIPVAEVINQWRVWKRVGFVIMVSAGLLLGLSEMDKYYNNPYFIIKMCLIWLIVPLHAIVFHKSVYGNPEALDKAPEMPRVAKVAAVSSLCIWIGIACCGRWIAYYEPKKGPNGAPVAEVIHAPAPALAAQLHR